MDANLPLAGFFAAGLWLIDAQSAAAPGAPLITHGLNTAGTARMTVFAPNPLYRADPEREWPALASAASGPTSSAARSGRGALRSAPPTLRG